VKNLRVTKAVGRHLGNKAWQDRNKWISYDSLREYARQQVGIKASLQRTQIN